MPKEELLSELDRLRAENAALRGLLLGETVVPSDLPKVSSPLLSGSVGGGLASTPLGRTASAIKAASADDFSLGGGAASSGSSSTGGPSLSSSKSTGIKAHELSAMAEIFYLFAGAKGFIKKNDLAMLHKRLGEPITDDEARLAVETISHGSDQIAFDDFVEYWDGSHPSLQRQAGNATTDAVLSEQEKKRREWYRARFKFMRAKIPNALVGRVYTEAEGVNPSHEFRLRFFYDDKEAGKIPISPWHDVPLQNGDGTFNMIVEIPKWTRKKFEISTSEPYNPIRQDVENGVLREYMWGDQLFNYGALPQTWENPNIVHPDTGRVGDNDPIDIVDIGTKQWCCGSIVRVKVLGVLGLIDKGETVRTAAVGVGGLGARFPPLT